VDKVTKGERVIVRSKINIFETYGDLYVKFMIKKLMMEKFSEIMDEFNIVVPEKEIVSDVKELQVSFSTANLKAGDYTIEIVPQFAKQPGKSAISVFSHPLVVESEEKEEQMGLIDLEFEVEPV
jgi:hypothetical protein